MKSLSPFMVLALVLSGMSASASAVASPGDSIVKIIFVPHARTEDQTKQTVNPGIVKIDFTKYAVKMLGGDLTYNTSKDSATLAYCDGLFDLKSPNTLWALGNHDLESGSRALIKKFTGRDSYYAYTRWGITFLILDTELSANGFTSTSIADSQLTFFNKVCDTITNSKFLFVLNSRYIWMVGNADLPQAQYLDSMAASSKSMTSTNMWTGLFPKLQAVKAKGIKIHWFSGDKALKNVTYTKDSVHFHAAEMSNTYTDSVNNVIVITYNITQQTVSTAYVKLIDINKTSPTSAMPVLSNATNGELEVRAWQTGGARDVHVRLQNIINGKAAVRMYSMNGQLYRFFTLRANETGIARIDNAGIYLIRALSGDATIVRKIIIQ